MRAFILLVFLLQIPLAQADGLFGKNKAQDSFAVKSVGTGEATLEGTINDLKAGDVLYYTRSPFKFTVTAIKGNQVTVAVPSGQTLAPGAALLRYPTDAIKKGMQTESKLKQALEE